MSEKKVETYYDSQQMGIYQVFLYSGFPII